MKSLLPIVTLLTFGAALNAQTDWNRTHAFPGQTTTVISVAAEADVYTVLAADDAGENRYSIEVDPESGDVISEAELPIDCFPAATRLSATDYLLTEPNATGFDLVRVTTSIGCTAVEVYRERIELGVGEETILGDLFYDSITDRVYVSGVHRLSEVSDATEVVNFIYAFDPQDGLVTFERSSDRITEYGPPKSQGVVGVWPEVGVFVVFDNASSGRITFSPYSENAPMFINIAEGFCGIGVKDVVANHNGQLLMKSSNCGKTADTYAVRVDTANREFIESSLLPAENTALTTTQVGAYSLDEAGDAYIAGRIVSSVGGAGTQGFFATRITLAGDSVWTYWVPEIEPTAQQVAVTPTGGAFVGGALEGSLFVARAGQGDISGLNLAPIAVGVFPNPASEYIQVSAGQVLAQAELYQVIDQRGSLVSQGVLDSGGKVSVAQLPAGIYTLRLPQQNVMAQIVINR